MEGYTVIPITYDDTKFWIKQMHYAHRMPSILYSFGLFKNNDKNNDLVGVVTYGMAPSCGANYGITDICGLKNPIELNRLCLLYNLKNEASFLISKTLKMIIGPIVIVSYADPNQNHIGFIYQATNWIYTGTGGQKKEYRLNGKTIHDRSLGHKGITKTVDRDKYIIDRGGEIIKKKPKHRYLYFIGSKKEKKQMVKKLKYPILPYPKGDSKQYEIKDEIKNKPRLTPLGF